jgi:hypothetical protein
VLPQIAVGTIVGNLPVVFIDEAWARAAQARPFRGIVRWMGFMTQQDLYSGCTSRGEANRALPRAHRAL